MSERIERINKKNKKRKQNKVNGRFYGRLLIICAEIFVLIVIVGVSLLLFTTAEKEKEQKEAIEKGIKDKFNILAIISFLVFVA